MEAEEVMQDTFIKVFQHLDRFSGNQKMNASVFTENCHSPIHSFT